MVFLVVSTPRRSRMSKELVEARLAFRAWIKSLNKRVECFYPRRDSLGWRPFGRGNFSYDFSEPADWILMQVPLRNPLVMIRFWLLLPLLFAWRRVRRG